MKRSEIVLALSAAIVLAGCSAKDDKAIFDTIRKNSVKYDTLRQSEKVIFNAGTEHESILFITYDFKHYLKSEEQPNEVFYISMSPAGSVRLSALRMQDDIKPLSIKRIPRSALPASVRAPVPSWFSSYKVEFPTVNLKKFSVTARENRGESKRFYFYKVPKYIVEKPEMIGISKP